MQSLKKLLSILSILISITILPTPSLSQNISNHLDLVDTSNGALKLQYEDVRISARGQDLDFIRSYNNQSQYNGPLGYNWHFNWNLTLSYRPSETRKSIERVYSGAEGVQSPIDTIGPEIKTTPEKVTIIETTGFLREFKKEEDKFVSIHFDVETVRRVEDGFVRELKDGTKQYFTTLIEQAPMPLPENTQDVWLDKNGKKHIKIDYFSNSGEREVYKLSKIVDKYGNTTQLLYDEYHRVIKVSDPAGRSLMFTYTPRGKIKTVTDPLNRQFSFSYDYEDNLIGITDPAAKITTLAYDDSHNLTKIVCPGDAVLRITYDRNNRAISLSGPVDNTTSFSYQSTSQGKGLVTTITDALGNKISHEYQPGYYEYNDKKLVIVDAEGKVGEKYRDERKNLVKYVVPNSLWKYEYDNKNNMTKMIDAENGQWNYTFDPNFNLVKTITNPNQATIEFTYDEKGNLINVKQPDGGIIQTSCNSYGEPVSLSNPNGHTIYFEYNTYGNLSSIKDPLNNKTTLEYDTVSRLTKITNAKRVSTEFTYDADNQITQIKDGFGNITRFGYNDRGNRIKITNALNQETKFEYDTADNLVKIIDALNNTRESTYDKLNNLTSIKDALGNIIRYNYNSNQRLISIIDASGNTTNHEYDSVGNIASIIDANGNKTSYIYDKLSKLTEVTEAEGGTTRYVYDSVGNLLSVTDANNHTKKYSYNEMNRLKSESDALSNNSRYEYDRAGNLIKRIDANGAVTAYTPDGLNRIVKISYPDSTEVNFGYDEVSNMNSYSNPNTSALLEYDSLNRLTRIYQPPFNKEIRYSYDALNNRKTMTDPNSGVTNYTYDELNRLISLTNPSNQITYYEYDALGRRTKMTCPNGVATTYDYDKLSRLLLLVHKKPTGETLASFGYAYDNIGNRLSMTTLEGKHEYTYDKIYQLTKVRYPDSKTQEFTYDPAGNRLTQLQTPNLPLQTYTYDSADRLLSVNHGLLTANYSYDSNGNMISKTDGAGTTTYQYDYENRLAKIIYPDERINIFGYSPLGQRIIKADSAGTTTYLYDTFDILCEFDQNNNLKTMYTFGPGIDNPISMIREGVDSYYHADGLGSIVNLTNANGNSVTSYAYEAFGSIRNSQSQIPNLNNPFRFTAREWDAESGLYYYRARSYEPGIGRFVQVDPIGIVGGINYYIYVENDPVNYVDPEGYGKFGIAIKVGKWGLKKGKILLRDAAKRLYKKQGKDVYGSKNTLKKWSKKKGKGKPPFEQHGEGAPHWHTPDRTGGHGFVPKTPAIIPGATLGHDIFGDNLLGDIADFFNPLSDIQDIVDLGGEDEDCK